MNTRILKPLLLGLMLCATSLHAQDTLVVSERVGKVIDSTERVYYQLFPEAEAFESAVFINEADGVTAYLLGRRGDKKVIDPANLELLHRYIDSHDSLYHALHGAEFQPMVFKSYLNVREMYAPLIEAELISPMVRFGAELITVQWKNTGDTTQYAMRGELLLASPTGLLLSVGRGEHANITYVPSSAIQSVSYEGRGNAVNILTMSAVGMFIAGTAGYALGASLGGCGNTGCTGLTTEELTIFTGAFALCGMVVGALSGAFMKATDETLLSSPDAYQSILPELQERMYYRYGLPPDSPWRDN